MEANAYESPGILAYLPTSALPSLARKNREIRGNPYDILVTFLRNPRAKRTTMLPACVFDIAALAGLPGDQPYFLDHWWAVIRASFLLEGGAFGGGFPPWGLPLHPREPIPGSTK